MIEDGFDLVYFFSFYQFRWWFREVLSVCFIFFVRFEKCCMEDVVDSP